MALPRFPSTDTIIAMNITVFLFAGLKDAVDHDQVVVELADGADTGALWAAFEAAYPAAEAYRGRVAFAVGDRLVSSSESLDDGAEVALLPPVSGG